MTAMGKFRKSMGYITTKCAQERNTNAVIAVGTIEKDSTILDCIFTADERFLKHLCIKELLYFYIYNSKLFITTRVLL